jgi:hypothetical protein
MIAALKARRMKVPGPREAREAQSEANRPPQCQAKLTRSVLAGAIPHFGLNSNPPTHARPASSR